MEVRVRGEPEPVSLSNRRAVFLVSFLSLLIRYLFRKVPLPSFFSHAVHFILSTSERLIELARGQEARATK